MKLLSNISMSSSEIIDVLCENLNDGIWALRVLYAEGAMNKEKLWDYINQYHKDYQLRMKKIMRVKNTSIAICFGYYDCKT